MNIVIDAMGGDYAPEVVVKGAIEATKELDVNLTFVGNKDSVEEELKKYDFDAQKVDIIHASEVVYMHEPAITSIRKKKDSSIAVGINLLKENSYDAFVSAGNTGAVVAAATIKLGMIKGVDRPAIGLFLPTLKGFCFLIDAGANTDPKPEHLLQSSLMAQVYSQKATGTKNPSIGLLNIGTEESKGTDFAKITHKLLADRLSNFVGNIEANDVYAGQCDCVICDGYVGNILLKVSQGLMESSGALIKREIKKDLIAAVGALILKTRLKNIKQLADYSEYGGAPLLGPNGVVMISHGRSSSKAIKNAIKAAQREVTKNILANLKTELTRK